MWTRFLLSKPASSSNYKGYTGWVWWCFDILSTEFSRTTHCWPGLLHPQSLRCRRRTWDPTNKSGVVSVSVIIKNLLAMYMMWSYYHFYSILSHCRTLYYLSPGYYCKDGLRFKCAEGKYGDTSGLHDEMCSGYCPRGHFCPENSINPIPCSPGSYSSGGAKECTSCEVPLTVPMEVINTMCRNDRSCCFDYE